MPSILIVLFVIIGGAFGFVAFSELGIDFLFALSGGFIMAILLFFASTVLSNLGRGKIGKPPARYGGS